MTLLNEAVSAADRIASVRALQPQLAANGFDADRDNADPTPNFALLGETGIQRLLVPQTFGGDWDGTPTGGWRDLIEASTIIASGDGPTGQNWGTTAIVARELFDVHATCRTKPERNSPTGF